MTSRTTLIHFVAATIFLIGAQPIRAQEQPLVVTHAVLIDGTGAAPQHDVAVVARHGKITAVGPSDEVNIPEDATVVNATGGYVIPGLADMHVHFGTGGLVARDSLTLDRVLRQFLFYGVTTVLNLGATGGSLDDILDLRRRDATGDLQAPHIYATGGLLTVPGGHPIGTIMSMPEGADSASYDWSQRGVWVVRTPGEVHEVVARLAAAGMDGVKIVIESWRPENEVPQMPATLIAAAVDEARRHDLPVFAHATSPDELEEAVDAGVHAVVHLVDLDPPDPDLLARMQDQHIYYIPTLSLFVWADTWGKPSEMLTDAFLQAGVEERVIESLLASSMAPETAPSDDDWAWRRGVLQELMAAHDAGIPLVAGTDTNNPFVFPGFSMHHELALMVEAGLTPMEALVAATRRPAEMLGLDQEFGTIEPGKRADMLILSASPLEDIRNTRTLRMIILEGQIIDRSAVLPDE